jgi:hypothetical protein
MKLRGKVEGIVGMALCGPDRNRWFDLDFLFIGVLLDVVKGDILSE